jgi:cytochrome c553
VAAYYASLSAPQAKAPSTPSGQSQKRGQTLATLGDEHLGVQACANCHGPNGAGEPPTYPYLAGQNIHYLNTAMDEWKSGARKTDPSEQMPMIARQLSRSDMASLAAYFASQPVPVPATQRTNIPLGSASHPVASGSTSDQKSVPTTGVSTEQGSPTEGGSQGPGGGGGASGSGPSGTPKSGQ